MILLNKFIQCLNGLSRFSAIRLNPSYVSGCLANSIILCHGRQNLIFSHFDLFYYGSYKCVKLYSDYVIRRLVFQRNDLVKRLEIYLSTSRKITYLISNDIYNVIHIYTDSDIKSILNIIYECDAYRSIYVKR